MLETAATTDLARNYARARRARARAFLALLAELAVVLRRNQETPRRSAGLQAS